MTDLAVAPLGTGVGSGVDSDAGSGVGSGVSSGVSEVSDNVVSLMRTFNRARARILAAAAHDVEWSSHVVLKQLQIEGSMRAGSLAECLRSDPSTVSRQVAGLVKDGLIERRSDPDDGRASLLVLTDRGLAVLAEHDKIRLRYFARMLDHWSAEDLAQFGGLLARFTEDFNQMNHEWVAEQIGQEITHAGGNHR